MPNEPLSVLALAAVFLASVLGGGINAIAGIAPFEEPKLKRGTCAA